MGIYIQEHDNDYSDYGLSVRNVALNRDWQFYTYEFTTKGFNSRVSDTRIRFWFAPFAAAGDVYMIDPVVLEKVGVATAAGEGDQADSGVTESERIYLPFVSD